MTQQTDSPPDLTRPAAPAVERRGRPPPAALVRELMERREALQQAEAALAQARKLAAVGQMTIGLVHDFNNLLTLIAGNLDVISQHAKGDDRIGGAIAGIAGAVDRGARLSGDLLTVSRQPQRHSEALRLDDVVRAFSPLAVRVLGDRVRLSIDADAALWPCRIDRAQFESAVLNLTINARDAMPRGGELGFTFRNLVDAGRRYVSVLAADSGSGMLPHVAARATEAFFTTKESGRGSGLGLSQVREFVERCGGALRIDSRPGEGTRVTMLFPADAKVNAVSL